MKGVIMFSPYAKSIAAAIGLLALVSKEFFNIEIGSETQNQIVDGIIALGTLLSVYGLSNKEK